jgi:hypothetical protein
MRVPLGWLKILDLGIGSRLVRSTMLHQWHMLSSSVTEEYDHAGSSECYPTPNKRLPWNKGKLIGAKPPLQPKHVWSIRTKLQIEGRAHDLAMFNLAIDNKLRGCNPAHERPLCAKSGRRVSLVRE